MRKLHRVAYEEDRCVVAYQVVIAFAGIKLQRKSTYVSPGIGATHLARDGGEARQHLGLAALLKQSRLGVSGDIFSGLEYSESTSAFGVRLTLRHLLAVEVRHLLQKVHV